MIKINCNEGLILYGTLQTGQSTDLLGHYVFISDDPVPDMKLCSSFSELVGMS